MQSIMQYIYDHPETVAIIWPVLTGLLSFAFSALSRRFPILTAILRASGLDLPALGRALRKRLEPPAPPATPIDLPNAGEAGMKAYTASHIIVHGPSAQSLYDAYVASSGGLNYQGKPCPKWDELPQAIRNHWQASAESVNKSAAHYLVESATATPITTTREAGE